MANCSSGKNFCNFQVHFVVMWLVMCRSVSPTGPAHEFPLSFSQLEAGFTNINVHGSHIQKRKCPHLVCSLRCPVNNCTDVSFIIIYGGNAFGAEGQFFAAIPQVTTGHDWKQDWAAPSHLGLNDSCMHLTEVHSPVKLQPGWSSP